MAGEKMGRAQAAQAERRMMLEMAAGPARPATHPLPNPFRFVAPTPLGDVAFTVVSGDRAEVSGAPVPGGGAGRVAPVEFSGRLLVLRAVLSRRGAGWSAREVDAVAYAGAGERPAPLPQDLVERLRAELPRALGPALAAERRRFVERELTDIYASRARREAEVAQVREEIERRRDKLKRLVRARDGAARAEDGRVDALRAELSGLGEPEVPGSSASAGQAVERKGEAPESGRP